VQTPEGIKGAVYPASMAIVLRTPVSMGKRGTSAASKGDQTKALAVVLAVFNHP
jgi:hypothetical protein